MLHQTLTLKKSLMVRKHMIIKDSVRFQSQFLVDLSNRANTTTEDLLYIFSENYAYLNEEMLHLLKIVKYPSAFTSNDRDEILNKLARIIKGK